MIIVNIPENHLPERQYILAILLGEFLGLEYRIEQKRTQHYELHLANQKRLIIEDHFFNIIPESTYLNEHYIPKKVSYTHNDFITTEDIPVLYGTDQIEQTTESIRCGIDIFAASFFMLTRWEEYAIKTRDRHERFPAALAFAVQHNLLLRPIVNEYLDMLWNMLEHLGISAPRKLTQFSINTTHDVDRPYRYLFNNPLPAMKDVVKLTLKKEFLKALKVPYQYMMINTSKRAQADPYNTFKQVMSLSEQHHIQSTFYFIVDFPSKMDGFYPLNHSVMQKLIEEMLARGHKLGLHGSYLSYNNVTQYQKEAKLIRSLLAKHGQADATLSGRQHYLRYAIETTPQLQAAVGMDDDGSLSYAEQVGFRCGTCYEYSMFDILSRQKLPLKQKPLLIMEVSLFAYMGLHHEAALEVCNTIKAQCKKYNGLFTILWHNDSLAEAKMYDFYRMVLSQ